MFHRFLRTSIAMLSFALSPVVAEATVYEAVWQVQLTRQIENNQLVEINRPTSFQYKVRFSNDVWYVEDDWETETRTFFDSALIIHTRPAMDYLPARPEGGKRLAYNNLYVDTVDYEWNFFEYVNFTEHETIDTGDLYWQHSTYLRSVRDSDARSGIGESDYAMTGEELLAYLEQTMTDPGAFQLMYSEHVYIRPGQFSEALYSVHWQGSMQLASLRAVDATHVPEPPLLALLGTGVAGIALFGRRKRHLRKEAC